jgi:hypothetical protein
MNLENAYRRKTTTFLSKSFLSKNLKQPETETTLTKIKFWWFSAV